MHQIGLEISLTNNEPKKIACIFVFFYEISIIKMITKSKYWKHTKIYNAFKIELNIFFFYFLCVLPLLFI